MNVVKKDNKKVDQIVESANSDNPIPPSIEAQNRALIVLVNAVIVAQKRGCFELSEAAEISAAINVFPTNPTI